VVSKRELTGGAGLSMRYGRHRCGSSGEAGPIWFDDDISK
jgi:hypothetical protein